MFTRVDESTFEFTIPGLAVFTVEWCESPIVLRSERPRIMLWLLPSAWGLGRSWWPHNDGWLQGEFRRNGIPFHRFIQFGPLDIRYQKRL